MCIHSTVRIFVRSANAILFLEMSPALHTRQLVCVFYINENSVSFVTFYLPHRDESDVSGFDIVQIFRKRIFHTISYVCLIIHVALLVSNKTRQPNQLLFLVRAFAFLLCIS